MGALLIGVMTTYLGYLVAIPISVTMLHVSHAMGTRLLVASAAFAALAVGVPRGLAWYRSLMTPRRRARLKRLPAVGPALDALGRMPTRLLRDRSVLAAATALQFVELTLDAGTLYVVMAALGLHAAPTAVFSSYVMASALSQVVPVPMGLGSFEAVLVFTLRLIGQSLEAALAATLIFRGLTFWVPMLPGVLFARQEI
jgi:uncharacterized membrane protein YbhN (UPF0104 family)